MCVWVDRRCKTDLTVHLHANLVSPLGGRQKRKSDWTTVSQKLEQTCVCRVRSSPRPKPQLQATHLQYGVREEAWRTGGRGGAEEAGEEEDFELQLQLALRAAEEAAIAEEDAVLAAEEAELSAEEAKYAAEQARLNAIAARQRLRQHSHEQLRQHSHEQHAAPGRRRLWSDLVGDPEVPSTVEIPPRGLPPPALLPLPTGKHALPMPLQRRGLPAPTWKRLREAQRASVQWEMALSSDRCELPPTGAALAATAAAAAAEAKVAAAATTARTAEDDVLDRELAALEAEEAELDRLEALEAALEVTLEAAKTKHWLLQHVPPPNDTTAAASAVTAAWSAIHVRAREPAPAGPGAAAAPAASPSDRRRAADSRHNRGAAGHGDLEEVVPHACLVRWWGCIYAERGQRLNLRTSRVASSPYPVQ